MKNYCPLPFGHLMSDTRGNYKVCCYHPAPIEHRMNINHHSLEEWRSNSYVQQVQESFKKDERHPSCKTCWDNEDAGRESLRTKSIKEYKILGTKDCTPNLVNVEVQVENLCNLTCLMCNESSSSAILAENKKLSIAILDQKDISWTDTAWQNFQTLLDKDIRVLNIRGGEPFYNKKLLNLIENLPQSKANQMMLHITTNGTTWTERWQNALSKFRLVRIMFSLDAVGGVYEYIRYPASWDQVEKNVLQICQMPNIKPLVHAVVQNLNIGSLGDLIDWCQKNNLYLDMDRLYEPQHLQIINLPVHVKDRTISYLKNLQSRLSDKERIDFIESCINEINSTDHDPELWRAFQEKISMRESVRGNDHRQIMEY